MLVSTGDKDFAQLVDARITLVNTMDGSVLDEAGVRAKFGIQPSQVVDLLALMGDKVDNIPGVPGIGEKTALALLTQFGHLEGIYADLAAVETLALRGAASVRALTISSWLRWMSVCISRVSCASRATMEPMRLMSSVSCSSRA